MSKDWSKDDKADIFFEGDKIPFGLNPGISNRQAGYQGSASQIRRSQSIRTDSMVQPQKTPITKPKVLVNTHNNTLSGAKSSGDVNRNDHNNYNNTRSNDNQYKSAQPLNSDSQHQHQQQRHGKQSPHIKMVEDTNFPPSGATGNRLERKATSNHLSEPKLKSGVSDRNYNSSNIYNNSQSRQGQQAPMRSQSEQIMHQYGKPPPKKPNVLESFGIKQPISTYNFYSDKGKENSTGIGNQSTKSRASNSKQNSDPSPPNRGKGGRPKKGSEVVDLSGEADSDDEDEVAVQEDEEEGEEGGYTNTTRRESSNSEVSGSRQKGSETSFKTLDAFQGQVPSGNDPKSYSENKLIALEFRLNSQFDLISLKSVFWDEIEYKSVGSLKCRADISAKFTTEDTSSGTQNLLTRLTNTAIDHTAERVDGFGSLGGRLTIYSTGVTFDIDDVDKMQSHVEGVADKFPIIQTEIMLNDIVSPM